LLKERTQTINNKIKLHTLGVPMNKLGNWLITYCRGVLEVPMHKLGNLNYATS